MMTELDVSSDRDQDVYVFQMKNGDPQQVVQVLQNMFGGSTHARAAAPVHRKTARSSSARKTRTTTMGTTTTSTRH